MAALPDVLSGIRIALALSFVLLISAELLASSAGLGYLIGFFGSGGDYAGMFAVILLVTIIGFAADRLYRALMTRALRWQLISQ
jgi:ABC-type nitrate/sulfonate/bicarbonate transport system permease component